MSPALTYSIIDSHPALSPRTEKPSPQTRTSTSICDAGNVLARKRMIRTNPSRNRNQIPKRQHKLHIQNNKDNFYLVTRYMDKQGTTGNWNNSTLKSQRASDRRAFLLTASLQPGCRPVNVSKILTNAGIPVTSYSWKRSK